jgi:signal transduction histidine kinase
VGLLDEAIRNTRNLTLELSPPVLFESGLAQAIAWAARRAADQHGLAVEVGIVGQERRLEQDVELTVFQAVKELLNNVARHARASRVGVTVTYRPGGLEVIVTDDGIGFGPSELMLTQAGGFGLLNVRERLAHINGELRLDSGPGAGSRVAISVAI